MIKGKIIILTNVQEKNLLFLLDRVTTKGIEEASVLTELVHAIGKDYTDDVKKMYEENAKKVKK